MTFYLRELLPPDDFHSKIAKKRIYSSETSIHFWKKNNMNLLNTPQKDAISHIEGPLLVLAGAGSGKTRVVTYRIAQLLDLGIPPMNILGLTFTNKAADEMKHRVRSLTSQNVLISTFHSLGARILRDSIEALGYTSDFVIYDEDDSEKILKSCLENVPLADKKNDFKTIRRLISQAKNEMHSPSDLNEQISKSSLGKIFPPIYSLYQEKLKNNNAVDFDDLLHLPVRLFREHPHILEAYQNRWKYLLVDEYQDTNAAQYTFIQLLAKKFGNLCVVGDPDQSIYSWRGANVGNILHFEKDYPGTRVVKLEQNYRSHGYILNAANALISHNQSRHHKNLWSDLGDGNKIKCYTANDERDEAAFVVDRVRIHKRDNLSLNDMVIFYRTNAQSRIFEDMLLAYRIPYTIVGGISFYQRREIKDILAFLRMIQTDSDFLAFQRTINLPKRGFGAATLDKIQVGALSEGLPLLNYLSALVDRDTLKSGLKLSLKQKENLRDYLMIVQKIKMLSQSVSLCDLLKAVIQETRYMEVLLEDRETMQDRKSNLDELISKAAEWEQSHDEPTLSEFLTELSLKTTLDESDKTEDCLRLMTLHNSKGLEFPVAFLAGMEEDLLPHINSKQDPTALEEERRLCYVGITRAMKTLYLSYAERRLMWGVYRDMYPSRFLREIPQEYKEKIIRALGRRY